MGRKIKIKYTDKRQYYSISLHLKDWDTDIHPKSQSCQENKMEKVITMSYIFRGALRLCRFSSLSTQNKFKNHKII